ncbi:MAG TPA: phosphatidylserine decarboxylase [Actinomycetota bacterium]|nr:phosphatidylserine decarboxylase [Actinomycetota bacterium]
MQPQMGTTTRHRVGGWLPDQDALEAWLEGFTTKVAASEPAFLSALNYHRWHAPVAGTIRKAWIVGGTYYSADAEGEDPRGPDDSQGCISQVATRAIVQIEAADPSIGLMTAIFVGMSEISSCVILPHVVPGYKVEKGEELGHFQYGGSPHCLVFGPGAIESFEVSAMPQPHNPHPPVVLLGSTIAKASRRP